MMGTFINSQTNIGIMTEKCTMCQSEYSPSITDACPYHSKDFYSIGHIELLQAVGSHIFEINEPPSKELLRFRQEIGRGDLYKFIESLLLERAFYEEKKRELEEEGHDYE